MELIEFILICFGLTSIITWGSLFDEIRPEHPFFCCCQCVGTWVGFIVFLLFWVSGIKLFPNIFIGTLLFGFLSGGTSYILDAIVDDDGIKLNKTNRN